MFLGSLYSYKLGSLYLWKLPYSVQGMSWAQGAVFGVTGELRRGAYRPRLRSSWAWSGGNKGIYSTGIA